MGDSSRGFVVRAVYMRKPRASSAGVAAVAVSLAALQLGNGMAVGLIGAAGAGIATCLRVGIGALALLPALWFVRYSAVVSLRRIVGYGVVLGLMQLCFYQAISHISLSLAVSIEFIVPLVLGCLRTRPRAVRLAVLGAVAGLFLIVDYASRPDPAGILWAVATGILLSVYIKVGTTMPTASHPLAVLSKALWVAFLVVLAGQILTPVPDLQTADRWVGQALVVALLTIAIPFSLELFAMKRLRALPFAMVSALDPALAAIVGVLGLNQYLDGRQITGLIVLTGCAVLSVWTDARAQTSRQLKSTQRGAKVENQ